LTYHYPDIRTELRLPVGNVVYQGQLNADATEITGTYSEPTVSIPVVVLKRTANPDTVPAPLTADECAPRRNSDLQGCWAGTVKDGNISMPITLKIVEQPAATFRAQFDNPYQGLRALPASVTYHQPEMKFEIDGIGLSFAGKLDNGSTISGTMTAGSGQSFPMTFKSVDPRAEARLETQKDYRYASPDELQGHWNGIATVDLNGNKVKLHLAAHIARMPDGSFFAALDSPDEMERGIASSSVLFAPPRVRLEWRGVGARFEGKLKDGKLTGTWFAGGQGPLGSPALMEFTRGE